LNLASAKGGNFAEKIANSAKDPLQAFATLGREAMKDERAIDMIAIKGAEEELGRQQKTGTFGQLINDIMSNNPGMDRAKAYEKALEISTAKSGKTIVELKAETEKLYFDAFVAEGDDVEEARRKAKQLTNLDFSVPEPEKETTTTTTTETDVIKID